MELEETFITLLHISLYDLDRTELDSLYMFLGYMARKKTQSDVITIGKRKYKKVTADNVHF